MEGMVSMSITAMPEYASFSFEELRMQHTAEAATLTSAARIAELQAEVAKYRADAQYWRNAKWKEAEAATAAAASAPAGVGDQSDVYVSTKADKRCRDDDATEEEAAEEAVGENEAENITSWGAAARGTPPGPA